MKPLAVLAVCLAFGLPAHSAQNQTAPKPDSKTAAAHSTIDPGKAADIERLMEVVDERNLMSQTMDAMVSNIRPTLISSLPAGDYRDKLVDLFFEKLRSKLRIEDLLDMAAAAYDKYLSDEDIQGMIQFYQTPLGQKTLTVLPKLTAELQAEGMRMGEEASRQSMMEVLAEHPALAKAMQDAAQESSDLSK